MEYYLCREIGTDTIRYIKFNDKAKAYDEAKRVLAKSGRKVVLLYVAHIEDIEVEVTELKIVSR